MDKRLKVVQFHDSTHCFMGGRGCRTAGLEAKLVQQFAQIEQHLLYIVFVDLKKAYDAMNQERCVEILRAYGVEPKMLGLIQYFWDKAVLVCRSSGRYGLPFKAYRGVTQGGPLLPKLFNIMVDAIVCEWLREELGDKAARDEIGATIRLFVALTYANDSHIVSVYAAMLQQVMDAII